jgi:hypothetical protein
MKTVAIFTFMAGSFVLGAWLDGSGMADRVEEELNISDARKAAEHQFRKELHAARLCREEYGDGVSVQWTASGELVCIPAHQGSEKWKK